MTPAEIRKALTGADTFRPAAFRVLRAIAALDAGEQTEHEARELAIRAYGLVDELPEIAGPLNALLRQMGLYPYVDQTALGVADAIAYEYHRPPGLDDDLVFLRVQAEV